MNSATWDALVMEAMNLLDSGMDAEDAAFHLSDQFGWPLEVTRAAVEEAL